MTDQILPAAAPLVTRLAQEIEKLNARPLSPADAKRVRDFAGAHVEIIAATLREWGPLTVDQIAERCPLTPAQVGKRLDGMRRAGDAATTGERVPSFSGKPARVWRVAK